MKPFITLLFTILIYSSCNNTGRTQHTTVDPQPEEIVIPSTLDYSQTAISKESVKFSIDNQDLIDILYNRTRDEHQTVGASVSAKLSIDISALSIYEDVVDVSCTSFDVNIALSNTNNEDFSETDGVSLYQGIITPLSGNTKELDCLDSAQNHYTVTFYTSAGILAEKNINIETKIIFTENKLTGVLGFRRANDNIGSENDYLFF